jgi:putative membrane protein insertion efficiency factor
VLILCVRGYQVVLSPMMGGACRFEPSCSNYMIEALQVHGPLKGLLLGLWRLLRCHPFGRSGYDPVPEKGRWRVRRFDDGHRRELDASAR